MPLTFDLSFEELVEYQGINPRPADFDAFWDSSLKEMRSIDPKVELIPADFQANGCQCFHFYFATLNERGLAMRDAEVSIDFSRESLPLKVFKKTEACTLK